MLSIPWRKTRINKIKTPNYENKNHLSKPIHAPFSKCRSTCPSQIGRQSNNTGTDTQTLTFNPATATVIKTTIALTNGGALSLQTSGSLTFTHTGPDTLEIHAPTAGHLEQVEEGTNTGYRILGSDLLIMETLEKRH